MFIFFVFYSIFRENGQQDSTVCHYKLQYITSILGGLNAEKQKSKMATISKIKISKVAFLATRGDFYTKFLKNMQFYPLLMDCY